MATTRGQPVPDESMPSDPFRAGTPDWSGIAANNHAFFMAHLAAGFSEAQAIELTARYLSFVMSVIFSHGAPQQPPEQGQGEQETP
jgi:hypothetical protein